MDNASVFAGIEKTVDQDDGSLLVYGKATDDSLDLDDQRCDADWLKTAMPAWFGTGHGVGGNIREQHRADSAIGKAIEHEAATDGHYITARIVDPLAVAKTRAGIFTGFSIGIRRPKIVKSPTAPNGLINGGTITEVSLVDRPANSNAILTLCKAAKTGWEGPGADLDQERGLVRCEELLIDDEAIAKELQVSVTKGVEAGDDSEQELADEQRPTFNITTKTLEQDAAVDGFDRDKAIELVDATLEKAADGLGQNESGDISGADQAIATIAQLIISEAQDLAKMPSQDCDIHLLMSAVDALRCFSRREQSEQAGVDPDVSLRAAVDVTKGKYSADQLRSMLASGKAMKNPNGEPSYPIGDKEDLSNAIHAVGRGSGDHNAIRAYIKRRASALGASDMIPDNWSSSGSNKAADSEAEEGKTMPEQVAAVDTPVDTVEADAAKSADVDTETPVKELDATKAAGDAADPDVLMKAFTDALVDGESELRKMFVDITEASTKSAVKALGDELGARLEKVEAMATPGGPALRRTEAERVSARRSDLLEQAMRFKALANSAEDQDLRKGYATKAARLEAEVKAL